LRRTLRRVGKTFDFLEKELGLSRKTIWRLQYYLRARRAGHAVTTSAPNPPTP